ncbi:MAG TPA: hypothetical protein VKF38_00975, partial [Anaerolineaceae bacterium]|nr:hypothetical protein [Anaerolineaceae bacterium]
SFTPGPAEPAAPAQPVQQSPAAPSDETPDWLKSFAPGPAENAAPAQPVQQSPAAPSDETPDWLKPFAPGPAESAAPAQPVQQSPAAPSDETPDWLKSFAPGPAENAAPSEEMPDWLKSFAPGTAESAAPAQPVQQSPAAPSDETPDWLKPFAAGPAEPAAPIQPVEQAQAAPAEETPDWLKSFTAEPAESAATAQPVEQAPAAPAEETPDWLKSFAAEPAEPAATAQPVEQAPAAPAEETPDWLKSFAAGPAEPAAPVQSVEQAQAAPAEETPDWLKSFATGPVEPAVPVQSVEQVPAAPAEETPDWLKSFAAGTKEAAAFSDAQPAQANEVPDQPQTVSAQPVSPAEAVVPSGQTPGISQPAEQAEPAQALPPLSGEVPDWLQNMAGRPAADEASPDLASQQPAGVNEPDWLQSFASAGATTASASDSGSKTAQPSKELAASENAPQAEPDWLNKITKVTPPVDQASTTPVTPAIETGGAVLGEIPDWLSNMKPQKIPTPEETGRPAFVLDSSSIDLPGSEELGKNPFAGEGVPDWLSQVPLGAEGQAVQAGQADDSGEHLEPAQLPGWLQAMRPLEAVAPAAVKIDDQRVEKSGPLAGIKGVLPVDDVVTQYRKPPSYSVKLKVSEKQRASANLLEQMLGQESSPQAIPQEHVRIPQRLVRLVIAILLIAVLLFPLLTRGANLVSPFLTPPADVVQFHTALDALPDGGHVLLAVDYDPGFSGEMHFAATGVLERLIEKNESLVLISTVPAGPVMAQDLISQTLQNRPDLAAKYAISNSVVNLGYLPGGATSLQEFAVAPRQATFYGFAAGVDANSPWQQPALQNIQDVSQFSMVLVLTDSLDSGRAWIEQVQPALKSTPLMMVVSAQTAPLIQPYVSSGQVKAMISGLAGGTAFQQYLNTTLNSLAVWNAYIYGLLVLVVFILLGIVIQIGNLLFSHRKSGG